MPNDWLKESQLPFQFHQYFTLCGVQGFKQNISNISSCLCSFIRKRLLIRCEPHENRQSHFYIVIRHYQNWNLVIKSRHFPPAQCSRLSSTDPWKTDTHTISSLPLPHSLSLFLPPSFHFLLYEWIRRYRYS